MGCCKKGLVEIGLAVVLLLNIFILSASVTAETTIYNLDVVQDDCIDSKDYSLVAQCYGQSITGTCIDADINKDLAIDGTDYEIVQQKVLAGQNQEVISACAGWRCMQETCNQKDDNCNGLIDDGISCLTCSPGATELCNLFDDDCDGLIDESLMETRNCGTGVCEGGSQSRMCLFGKYIAWSKCSTAYKATEDTCNGIDDNCNGLIDEKLTLTRNYPEGCLSYDCSEYVAYRCYQKTNQVINDAFISYLLNAKTAEINLVEVRCANTTNNDFHLCAAKTLEVPTICGSIQSAEIKDLCYYSLGTSLKDHRICLNVSDKTTRNKCIDTLNAYVHKSSSIASKDCTLAAPFKLGTYYADASYDFVSDYRTPVCCNSGFNCVLNGKCFKVNDPSPREDYLCGYNSNYGLSFWNVCSAETIDKLFGNYRCVREGDSYRWVFAGDISFGKLVSIAQTTDQATKKALCQYRTEWHTGSVNTSACKQGYVFGDITNPEEIEQGNRMNITQIYETNEEGLVRETCTRSQMTSCLPFPSCEAGESMIVLADCACTEDGPFCETTCKRENGFICSCSSECSSGHCWSDNFLAQNFVAEKSYKLVYQCKSTCAPADSYTPSADQCCSGLAYNEELGKCQNKANYCSVKPLKGVIYATDKVSLQAACYSDATKTIQVDCPYMEWSSGAGKLSWDASIPSLQISEVNKGYIYNSLIAEKTGVVSLSSTDGLTCSAEIEVSKLEYHKVSSTAVYPKGWVQAGDDIIFEVNWVPVPGLEDPDIYVCNGYGVDFDYENKKCKKKQFCFSKTGDEEGKSTCAYTTGKDDYINYQAQYLEQHGSLEGYNFIFPKMTQTYCIFVLSGDEGQNSTTIHCGEFTVSGYQMKCGEGYHTENIKVVPNAEKSGNVLGYYFEGGKNIYLSEGDYVMMNVPKGVILTSTPLADHNREENILQAVLARTYSDETTELTSGDTGGLTYMTTFENPASKVLKSGFYSIWAHTDKELLNEFYVTYCKQDASAPCSMNLKWGTATSGDNFYCNADGTWNYCFSGQYIHYKECMTKCGADLACELKEVGTNGCSNTCKLTGAAICSSDNKWNNAVETNHQYRCSSTRQGVSEYCSRFGNTYIDTLKCNEVCGASPECNGLFWNDNVCDDKCQPKGNFCVLNKKYGSAINRNQYICNPDGTRLVCHEDESGYIKSRVCWEECGADKQCDGVLTNSLTKSGALCDSKCKLRDKVCTRNNVLGQSWMSRDEFYCANTTYYQNKRIMQCNEKETGYALSACDARCGADAECDGKNPGENNCNAYCKHLTVKECESDGKIGTEGSQFVCNPDGTYKSCLYGSYAYLRLCLFECGADYSCSGKQKRTGNCDNSCKVIGAGAYCSNDGIVGKGPNDKNEFWCSSVGEMIKCVNGNYVAGKCNSSCWRGPTECDGKSPGEWPCTNNCELNVSSITCSNDGKWSDSRFEGTQYVRASTNPFGYHYCINGTYQYYSACYNEGGAHRLCLYHQPGDGFCDMNCQPISEVECEFDYVFGSKDKKNQFICNADGTFSRCSMTGVYIDTNLCSGTKCGGSAECEMKEPGTGKCNMSCKIEGGAECSLDRRKSSAPGYEYYCVYGSVGKYCQQDQTYSDFVCLYTCNGDAACNKKLPDGVNCTSECKYIGPPECDESIVEWGNGKKYSCDPEGTGTARMCVNKTYFKSSVCQANCVSDSFCVNKTAGGIWCDMNCKRYNECAYDRKWGNATSQENHQYRCGQQPHGLYYSCLNGKYTVMNSFTCLPCGSDQECLGAKPGEGKCDNECKFTGTKQCNLDQKWGSDSSGNQFYCESDKPYGYYYCAEGEYNYNNYCMAACGADAQCHGQTPGAEYCDENCKFINQTYCEANGKWGADKSSRNQFVCANNVPDGNYFGCVNGVYQLYSNYNRICMVGCGADVLCAKKQAGTYGCNENCKYTGTAECAMDGIWGSGKSEQHNYYCQESSQVSGGYNGYYYCAFERYVKSDRCSSKCGADAKCEGRMPGTNDCDMSCKFTGAAECSESLPKKWSSSIGDSADFLCRNGARVAICNQGKYAYSDVTYCLEPCGADKQCNWQKPGQGNCDANCKYKTPSPSSLCVFDGQFGATLSERHQFVCQSDKPYGIYVCTTRRYFNGSAWRYYTAYTNQSSLCNVKCGSNAECSSIEAGTKYCDENCQLKEGYRCTHDGKFSNAKDGSQSYCEAGKFTAFCSGGDYVDMPSPSCHILCGADSKCNGKKPGEDGCDSSCKYAAQEICERDEKWGTSKTDKNMYYCADDKPYGYYMCSQDGRNYLYFAACNPNCGSSNDCAYAVPNSGKCNANCELIGTPECAADGKSSSDKSTKSQYYCNNTQLTAYCIAGEYKNSSIKPCWTGCGADAECHQKQAGEENCTEDCKYDVPDVCASNGLWSNSSADRNQFYCASDKPYGYYGCVNGKYYYYISCNSNCGSSNECKDILPGKAFCDTNCIPNATFACTNDGQFSSDKSLKHQYRCEEGKYAQYCSNGEYLNLSAKQCWSSCGADIRCHGIIAGQGNCTSTCQFSIVECKNDAVWGTARAEGHQFYRASSTPYGYYYCYNGKYRYNGVCLSKLGADLGCNGALPSTGYCDASCKIAAGAECLPDNKWVASKSLNSQFYCENGRYAAYCSAGEYRNATIPYCHTSCGADPACNGLLPGEGSCDENCKIIAECNLDGIWGASKEEKHSGLCASGKPYGYYICNAYTKKYVSLPTCNYKCGADLTCSGVAPGTKFCDANCQLLNGYECSVDGKYGTISNGYQYVCGNGQLVASCSGGAYTDIAKPYCQSSCGADAACNRKLPGTNGCDANCKVIPICTNDGIWGTPTSGNQFYCNSSKANGYHYCSNGLYGYNSACQLNCGSDKTCWGSYPSTYSCDASCQLTGTEICTRDLVWGTKANENFYACENGKYISYCNGGQYIDFTSPACRTECGADSACNGKAAGTNNCDANCKFTGVPCSTTDNIWGTSTSGNKYYCASDKPYGYYYCNNGVYVYNSACQLNCGSDKTCWGSYPSTYSCDASCQLTGTQVCTRDLVWGTKANRNFYACENGKYVSYCRGGQYADIASPVCYTQCGADSACHGKAAGSTGCDLNCKVIA